MFKSRVVVYGCGNILKGDDGAGPELIRMLEAEEGLPGDVGFVDVGTSIKQVLFDLVVMDPKPERIVIVDATTQEGREPGEFWEIDIEEMAKERVKDFSLHMFPSVNLLKEIREQTDVDIRIIVIQTAYIPDELYEGLSEEVTRALPRVLERVKELLNPEND